MFLRIFGNLMLAKGNLPELFDRESFDGTDEGQLEIDFIIFRDTSGVSMES